LLRVFNLETSDEVGRTTCLVIADDEDFIIEFSKPAKED
jgi:hypothetical protein